MKGHERRKGWRGAGGFKRGSVLMGAGDREEEAEVMDRGKG